jgi:hypothetical protein
MIRKEVTGRDYGRIYQCPAVYAIIARAPNPSMMNE